MRFRSVTTPSPLLFSLALTPLLALSCAAPDAGDAGSAGSGGSGGAEAGEEVVSEAQEAIAITRTIPIRFIEPLPCKPGTAGCNPLKTAVELGMAVDRANTVFADQGIRFWIKSVEQYHLPKFAARNSDLHLWAWVKNPPIGTTEDTLRTVFPAMTYDSYHSTLDAKSTADWMAASSAFFGEPDEIIVWLVAPGPSMPTNLTQSYTMFPEEGRHLVIVAANTIGSDQNGSYGTTHLAHELGHYFGVPHPEVATPRGRNPDTQAPWTLSDSWDLVYCAPYVGVPTRFFTSEADFNSHYCPPGFAGRILQGDGDGSNCWSDDPFGVVHCTVEGETYSSGDPEVDDVLWVDNTVPHNPPVTSRYGTNVMSYYSYYPSRSTRAPSRFSPSQLYQIQQYKTYEIGYDSDKFQKYTRYDGSFPVNGNLSGFMGMRPSLGTSTEDFIWWSNGDTSFKSQIKPVNGANYTPVSGDFDDNGYDDILWYSQASGNAFIWWSNGNKVFESSPLLSFGAGYSVISGDFDGVFGDDLFFYHPGADKMYWGNGTRTLTLPSHPYNVTDGLIPAVGNFDNLGGDDILWYGAATGYFDVAWSGGASKTFYLQVNQWVGAGYTPIAGNFDGQGADDLFWYAPGIVQEKLWYGEGNMLFDKRTAASMSTSYTVFAGDFDGDGGEDIFFDSETSTSDQIWRSNKNRAAPFTAVPTTVNGAFRPIPGKFDGTWQGKNATDIFWYRKP